MDEVTTSAIAEAIAVLTDALEEPLKEAGRSLDAQVLDLVREVGRGVVKEVLGRAAADLVEVGKERGLVTQRVPTVRFYCVFGRIEVDSPYMWCAVDQFGWRPLREQFGVMHNGRSERVERALTDFGSDRSFEQAARGFEEHYGWSVGRTTVRNVTQRQARQAEEFVDRVLDEAARAFLEPIADRPGRDHVVVQLDGCTARTGELMTARRAGRVDLPPNQIVRREEWREVRTGLARGLDQVEPTYVCRIDTYDGLTEQLFGAACAHGLTEKTTVIAPSDGAFGLREALEDRFAKLHFVLDFPHLKGHVYETADALGMADGLRERWAETVLDRIWDGRAPDVLRDLRELHAETENERVRRLVDYLERFADAVDYRRMVDDGWPIGSGEVESAHRFIPQARLKLPGACWRVENVNPMLALRLLKANGWWDRFWAEAEDRRAAA